MKVQMEKLYYRDSNSMKNFILSIKYLRNFNSKFNFYIFINLKRYQKGTYDHLVELIDFEEYDPLEILLKLVVCDGEHGRENRNQLFN